MVEKTPVFYKINTPYAITINPNDQNQGLLCKTAWSRMLKVSEMLEKHLEDAVPTIIYKLYMDISEPQEMNLNKAPRIHFHGIILFETHVAILEWLLIVASKLSRLCYIDIDTIKMDTENILKWKNYCNKYKKITTFHCIQNQLNFKDILKLL